jgi:hypothetical protein
MKLGIVMSECSPIYQQAAFGFAQGLKCDYYMCKDTDVKHSLNKCDSYVLVGNDYKDRPAKQFVYKSGKPFVVVTGSFFEVKNPSKYVRVHVNGFVNNMCDLPSANYNRWEQLVNHYKFKNIFKKRDGKGILIALNAKTSPAMMSYKLENWLYDTVKQLRDVTDEPIYIRHHRKRKKGYTEKYNEMKKQFKVKEETDTRDAGIPVKYRTALSFTTTFSVQSLMYGTPHICGHPGNFVSNITPSEITKENLDFYPNEDDLAHHYARLARCEWTVEEIKSGECWDTLRPLPNNKTNYQWLGDDYATV